MDVNLTGTVAANTIQSGYSGYIIAAAGVIVGATITSGLTLLRDILNRKQDRNDLRNKLIGQLKGQKGLTPQYYAFYFYSFIEREYLMSRSVIQATYAIDYENIYSFPESDRNREIMRQADKAQEESIEYSYFQKEDAETKKWKEKLAKSNKELFTIIGSLQTYFIGDSLFDELDKASKQVEEAMDNYAKLEGTTMLKFNSIRQKAQELAGSIPQEAYEEESKIDATLDSRWTTYLDAERIKILIPRIRTLQHKYFISNVNSAVDIENEIKEERKSASKDLDDKIEALIYLYESKINKHWWQFWR